eukprot:6182179-Pleurochrysis_carterae.AAC.3
MMQMQANHPELLVGRAGKGEYALCLYLLHTEQKERRMASASAAVRRGALRRRQVPEWPWRPDLSVSDERSIWS